MKDEWAKVIERTSKRERAKARAEPDYASEPHT